MILGDEQETGLRRKRRINGEAERLNLDFTYGTIGPRLLCLNLNSELLSEAKAGISGINPREEETQQSEETCRAAGVCRRHRGGAREWHQSPVLVFPSLSDAAEQAGLPRAAPAQFICACFTMVLIKSPWSLGACVRSSHQKSKQRPGVADSLIM